jgi:hypothetical protein
LDFGLFLIFQGPQLTRWLAVHPKMEVASHERRTTLADLPHVTLLLICRFSGTRASLRFQLTCKDFASIVNDDYLWKLLVAREWRGVNPSLAYWAPMQSWRSVYHFMNEYGTRRSPATEENAGA